MKLLFSAFLGLGCVAAADCEYYYKIADSSCADSCLPATIGICPRDLVVTTGGLKGGNCTKVGYTVDKGPTSQKAGPCGTLTFEQYSKPGLAGKAGADVTKLATFSDPATTWKWQDQNDPVMGGASTSKFTVDQTKKIGVFNGTCAIIPFLNAPGFAKIATVGATFPDLSSFMRGGIQMRLRSTTPAYAGYRMAWSAKDIPRNKYSGGSFKAGWSFPDSASTEWQVVTVPFGSFSYDWSGFTGRCDTKDPDGTQHVCCTAETPEVCPSAKYLSAVTDVEIWAEGVEGDFYLEVDYVGVSM